MQRSTEFTFELVKLQDGARVLRVADPASGTCLERVVRSDVPVIRQKGLLQQALSSVLQRELKESAA